MTYFFAYPFGVSGDRADIPELTQTSGTVSYQKGFTYNYQRVLGDDPLAIPVPRDQSNQLYYAITENIQQYQTQGVPNWITAADNLGTSYPYGIYAICRYDAGSGIQIWESTTGANTSTPGVDANWRVISGNAQGVPVGTVIDFAGISIPDSYLPCDDATLLRATYPALLAALTSVQTVTLTAESPTFTATSSFGLYVGMAIESPGFPSTTLISALDGTTVTASANASASGATAVTFFQWSAGDGTTTFKAPDFRRRTSIGQGGTLSTVIGSQVGQRGGAETVTLGNTNMPAGVPVTTVTSASEHVSLSFGTFRYIPTSTAAYAGGSSTAVNIMQPSNVVYKLIKYV